MDLLESKFTVPIAEPGALASVFRCPVDKSALYAPNNETSNGSSWRCPVCLRRFEITQNVLNLVPDYPVGLNTPMRHGWFDKQVLFERYLNAYSATAAAHDVALADEAMALLPSPRGAVLDIGGGSGQTRKYCQDIDYFVSLDPFLGWLIKDKAFNQVYLGDLADSPFYFVRGLAEFLPLANDSFDWVLMRSVLDHCMDIYFVVSEASRVLRPNGMVLVGAHMAADAAPINMQGRVLNSFKTVGVRRTFRKLVDRANFSGQDHHITNLSRQLIVGVFTSFGFTLEHSIPYPRSNGCSPVFLVPISRVRW